MNIYLKKFKTSAKSSMIYMLIITLSIILQSNLFAHECGTPAIALDLGASATYTISGNHIANYEVTKQPFSSVARVSPTTITNEKSGVFIVSSFSSASEGLSDSATFSWAGVVTEDNPEPTSGSCTLLISINEKDRICGVELLTEDDQRKRKKRGFIYDFRDNVLARTSTGRHLTNLYYKHDNEVNEILSQYPDVFSKAKDMLKRFLPDVLAMSVGLDIKLQKNDVDDIIELFHTVSYYAGAELRNDIFTFINDIEEEGILEGFGIEIDE